MCAHAHTEITFLLRPFNGNPQLGYLVQTKNPIKIKSITIYYLFNRTQTKPKNYTNAQLPHGAGDKSC